MAGCPPRMYCCSMRMLCLAEPMNAVAVLVEVLRRDDGRDADGRRGRDGQAGEQPSGAAGGAASKKLSAADEGAARAGRRARASGGWPCARRMSRATSSAKKRRQTSGVDGDAHVAVPLHEAAGDDAVTFVEGDAVVATSCRSGSSRSRRRPTMIFSCALPK